MIMKAQTPLLPVQRNVSSVAATRHNIRHRCCITSKPACFILLWNFAVLLIYKALYDTAAYMKVNRALAITAEFAAAIILISIISIFAGVVTDVKFSRYKAVSCSSYVIIISVVLVVANTGTRELLYQLILHTISTKNSIILPLTITNISLFVILIVPVMIFLVNALQFGMDQLHDSPTEDLILFIHWYVWIYYVAVSFGCIAWNFTFDAFINPTDTIETTGIFGISFSLLLSTIILFLLIASIYVVQSKKVWFHIEPAGVNPYKLVYRVVKFAYQHKVPLRRSAFTYCEDEFPSRMDLGKHKYGGPFTTKEVEDVKAFWGILKILIFTGPAFMLQTVMQSTLPAFAKHSNLYKIGEHYFSIEGAARHTFISNGLLSPLLTVFCIPVYLCFIRPYISLRIPGMLKRIGLGIVLMILSLAASSAMDLIVHARKTKDARCMFSGLTHANFSDGNIVHNSSALNDTSLPLYQNIYFFISQHFLSAVTNMLVDVAVLEFTCSQSPYSMKGLILGSFFAIKALIQAIVVASLYPFGLFWHFSNTLNCGSGFYLMNTVIGVLELALFTFVAKKYKYRTVDEPSNEYRYAEEYYSNLP